ncbi:glycosyl hydrolase [Streptomyces sp. NPDC000151]|uniref:glycosyl hydrolase n=1 Tax=Streptomyces sp. NPDC000151 TaxID=3154244 RepID=UPI003321F625
MNLSAQLLPGTTAHAAAPRKTLPVTKGLRRDLAASPAAVRPKFRWWWAPPYGKEGFEEEVAAFADAGFGTVEIAFNEEGWATPSQRQTLRTVLQHAERAGIKVDLTLGAAWPVTTPNTSKNRLSQQELIYGRHDLEGEGRFHGPVPRPLDDAGTTRNAKLIAVTAARVLSPGPAVTEVGTPPASTTVLDPDSLVDLTALVRDGVLDWTAPTGPHVLFAFWQRNSAQDISDVLNAESVAAVTDYIEREQIGRENLAALRSVGNHFFEDSLECETTLFWTWKLLEEFQARRGYDLVPYLPLVFVQGRDGYWVPDPLPRPDFDLPQEAGERVRRDFYRTLTDLYVHQHLLPLQRWASTLGMRFRSQVAFGNTFDAIRSARELARSGGVVDDETLNAGDFWPLNNENLAFTLDHYRSLAGGSHQGGGNQVSLETGAEMLRANKEWLSDYKNFVDKAWACGITRPVIHGYGHQSPDSPWPGWDRFGGLTSESWNHRTFPQWDMWKPLANYWARGALLLELGRARVDLAVYRDGFLTTAARAGWQQFVLGDASEEDLAKAERPTAFFDSVAIENAGYSLEFIDPLGITDAAAQGNGMLYPQGPRYRALIVDERALPGNVAQALLRHVRRGLAVVFVGSLPQRGTGNTDAGTEDHVVRESVRQIMRSGRALRAAEPSDVLAALNSLKIRPAAAWDRQVPVYSQRRDLGDTELFYLWNAGQNSESFTASFAVDAGAPQVIDLWTGKTTDCAQYSQDQGRTRMTLTLEPGETLMLMFGGASYLHAVDGSAHLFATEHGQLEARETSPGARHVRLSDGSARSFTVPALPDARSPESWHLRVEEAAPHGTVVHGVRLDTLKDWREIEALASVSGRGRYTAAVHIPGTWLEASRGVRLELGEVHGSIQVQVNGSLVTPGILPTSMDVTELLRPGTNHLTVDLTTTLRNELVRVARQSSAENLALYAKYPSTQPYGLLGPVRLLPYARVKVAPSTTSRMRSR